jgi:hypothetical protein
VAVAGSRFFLTAAVAAAIACRGAGDPAADRVRSLARAAGHRDAGAIVAALSPSFEGSFGMGRADVDAELRRLFAAYASVTVSVSDLATERYPEFTLARFRVEFRGAVRRIGGLEGILPSSARYRFELRLVPEGREYRVASAHWEEMGSGAR